MTAEPYRYAVLLATRGRPHNLARLHSAIMDTAARPDLVDIWCYIDTDDPAGLSGYMATEIPVHHWIEGPRVRLAASWNVLAEQAYATGRYTHFLLWGDDVLPETLRWDVIFAARTAADGPGFVYGRDGIWDEERWVAHPEHLVLPTAVAMSTELYPALGWVALPGITHLCLDLVWRDLGQAAGCLYYEQDVMIRHLHPFGVWKNPYAPHVPDDATYAEIGAAHEMKQADALAHATYVDSAQFRADVEAIRHEARGASAWRAW